MPQFSYSLNHPVASAAGQAADSMPEECYTGLAIGAGAQTVTATVANSTAYQLTFVTSAGNLAASYTSDGSATKAEVVTGLALAVNAIAQADYAAVNSGGDLVLIPKPGVNAPRAVSSTGAGTLALAARSGVLPFGVIVAFDRERANALDPQTVPVRLPLTGDTALLVAGLVRFTHNYEGFGAAVASLPAGLSVSVAKKGHFWVTPEVAVAPGDQAFFRVTANGGLTQLGALRNDADSGNAVTLGAAARFISGASAGGFAVLELNIP